MLRQAIISLWLATALSAQVPLFPPECLARIEQGIHDIYNMEYARAAENFQSMIQEAPDDPAGYAYLARTYWIEELSKKQELTIDRFASSDFFVETPKYRPKVDPAAEERFRRTNQQAIEKARARLEENPDDRAALFLRGLAYQNLASFETSLKRSWWPAFKAGDLTLSDHRKLLRRDPSFDDARLSVGVYEYVAGSLPWHVKLVALLFGKWGSKERGREQLQIAAEKGTLSGDDARIMLILIHTREKEYGKALATLSQLQQKYPQNYLVHLDMGGMALLMNEPERAVSIYEEILKKRDTGEHKYSELERALLFNRLGVAFREKRELEAAATWFRKALAEDKLSSRSATIARLELGKTLDLMGKRGEALAQYRAVESAEDIAGSRAEAQSLLRSSFRE
jgi:predicted Zn-dependent protease